MLRPNVYPGFKNPLWLSTILTGIPAALHILCLQAIGSDSLLFDGVVTWAIIGSLIMLQKVQLTLPAQRQSGVISLFLVMFLGIGTLWGSTELFLRAYPIVFVAVLAGFMGGQMGLRRATPLLMLCLLLLPTRNMLTSQTFLTEPTAQFVHNLLGLFGLDNDRQHSSLTMGQHLIRIIPECASVGTMRRMLILGLWFALIQPGSFIKSLWIPLLTCCYAFFANGFRVAALVALKVTDHPNAFIFWHDGLGAKALPIIILTPLLLLYWLMLRKPSRSPLSGS